MNTKEPAALPAAISRADEQLEDKASPVVVAAVKAENAALRRENQILREVLRQSGLTEFSIEERT